MNYISISFKFIFIFFLFTQISVAEDNVLEAYKKLFQALPKVTDIKENSLSNEKIKLGKKLYFETKLSKAGDISCNSCHQLDNYGVDNKAFSEGHKGQLGGRNSPTVYNSALHFLQFWDGRAKDVEEQALGPILNPVEMAMDSEDEVVKRLQEDESYKLLFELAFPNEKSPLTFKNVGKAIGAFERTLITPARFDDFLNGDNTALNKDEKKGFKLFVEKGCTACHSGALLGGSMFQKLGLVFPYKTKDIGLAEVSKKESDKYFFKVPSLRNVEKTAPYFHDGSIKSLDEAVRLMAFHQLGNKLSDEEVGSIVIFLRSLTADIK